MDNGEWRIHVEIPADFVTIQLLRDDSLSQPAADSSLGEGAWTGPQKPPSLREVAREAGRKESTTEQLQGVNEQDSLSPVDKPGGG